ncbi:MAG: DUF881 domain-containing protein [Peptococcaceae bacterium]|jgi:uncharacterized protein YlxW (UPF0749 family)|nr:DUF881 domain-containing protein [Peptococcaceae bacterium]
MKLWYKNLLIPLTIAAIVLGYLISLQIQTHKESVTQADQISQERIANIQIVLAKAREENDRLQKERQILIENMEDIQNSESNPQEIALLNTLGIMDGTRVVQGLGIQIEIDDRGQEHKIVFPLTTSELMEIINILRFAGAEAISVNGQRIVGQTAIVNSGMHILVNQVPIRQGEGIPYVISAIGNQDYLTDYFMSLEASALKERGGMSISVTKKTVQISSYKGSYNFKYAKPLDAES